MSGQGTGKIWEKIDGMAAQINTQSVLLAEIKTLLATSVSKELGCARNDIDRIESIQRDRSCQAHSERIRSLEWLVRASLAGVFGLLAKTVLDWLGNTH